MIPTDHTPVAVARPAPREITEVAPGLGWIRLPLPFRLNHVNCWALRDGEGWTLIDCGVDTPHMRQLWDELGRGALQGLPVRRLLATHGHTDHVGLAGYMVERHEAAFQINRTEWYAARLRFADATAPDDPGLRQFLCQHGCGPEVVESYQGDRGRIAAYLGRLPPAFTRIEEGDEIRIGPRIWRAIVAGGHADGHVSLHCAADGILLAGDQILPGISPVVAVGPSEPDADPLGEYLGSFDRFLALDRDTLVLPSHGLPFQGLHSRIDGLAQHHADRLEALEALLDEPVTGAEATAGLFARAVREGQGRLALGETVAHLNRLVRLGRASRETRDGVHYFRTRRTNPA